MRELLVIRTNAARARARAAHDAALRRLLGFQGEQPRGIPAALSPAFPPESLAGSRGEAPKLPQADNQVQLVEPVVDEVPDSEAKLPVLDRPRAQLFEDEIKGEAERSSAKLQRDDEEDADAALLARRPATPLVRTKVARADASDESEDDDDALANAVEAANADEDDGASEKPKKKIASDADESDDRAPLVAEQRDGARGATAPSRPRRIIRRPRVAGSNPDAEDDTEGLAANDDEDESENGVAGDAPSWRRSDDDNEEESKPRARALDADGSRLTGGDVDSVEGESGGARAAAWRPRARASQPESNSDDDEPSERSAASRRSVPRPGDDDADAAAEGGGEDVGGGGERRLMSRRLDDEDGVGETEEEGVVIAKSGGGNKMWKSPFRRSEKSIGWRASSASGADAEGRVSSDAGAGAVDPPRWKKDGSDSPHFRSRGGGGLHGDRFTQSKQRRNAAFTPVRPWIFTIDVDALPSVGEAEFRAVMKAVALPHASDVDAVTSASDSSSAASLHMQPGGGIPHLRQLYSVMSFEAPPTAGNDAFEAFTAAPPSRGTAGRERQYTWLRRRFAARDIRIFSDYTKGAYLGALPLSKWLDPNSEYHGRAVPVEYMPKHEPYFIAKVCGTYGASYAVGPRLTFLAK